IVDAGGNIERLERSETLDTRQAEQFASSVERADALHHEARAASAFTQGFDKRVPELHRHRARQLASVDELQLEGAAVVVQLYDGATNPRLLGHLRHVRGGEEPLSTLECQSSG